MNRSNKKKVLTSWEKKVLRLVSYIPEGRVTTYKELAGAAGDPLAARAAGNALNKNPYSPLVPCHRVVKSDGAIGGFAGGRAVKKKWLEREGVPVKKGKVVGVEKIMYKYK